MRVRKLFCAVDDFCQVFEPKWHKQCLTSGTKQRNRARDLALRAMMTIVILFHQSHYRSFKAFYTEYVCVHLCGDFPGLVSYTRFVAFFPQAFVPLLVYLHARLGRRTGILFVDATKRAVCHNRRIQTHRVFRGVAARGKPSVGWFFGFKLHVVFNDCGELLTFRHTPGNVDDRAPIPQFAKQVYGTLFGDTGYRSHSRAKQLASVYGIALITPRRKNMQQRELPRKDTLLLRKRAIVETIIDQLKNISQIEHTRHRSPTTFLVNLVCGFIAYCHHPKKPSLQRDTLPPATCA